MIYPVLTEFEWGIAGIIGIIILIVGIRAIVREEREAAPKPPSDAEREANRRRTDEITSEVKANIDRVKSDWEKRYGQPWDG